MTWTFWVRSILSSYVLRRLSPIFVCLVSYYLPDTILIYDDPFPTSLLVTFYLPAFNVHLHTQPAHSPSSEILDTTFDDRTSP